MVTEIKAGRSREAEADAAAETDIQKTGRQRVTMPKKLSVNGSLEGTLTANPFELTLMEIVPLTSKPNM